MKLMPIFLSLILMYAIQTLSIRAILIYLSNNNEQQQQQFIF
jgi:hypothetical protein